MSDLVVYGIPQPSTDESGQGFADLGLGESVIEVLDQIGFERPTPIQAAIIPLALEGGDLIGLAQTGSGKTAAFVLPMLETLEPRGGVQALIVCPTREIAVQTKEFLDATAPSQDLSSVVLIGGVSIGPQLDQLKRGIEIVVATPGRLLDHMDRRTVRLNRLRELVIDEADHMLDLGFLPQIRDILQELPEKRRTMMFSATMSAPIERLAQRFMADAVRIDLRPASRAAEGIEHRLYLIESADKKACLLALAEEEKGCILMFMRRKIDTEWACRQLALEGHAVERMNSDLSQQQRQAALRGFKDGKYRILVATDVAARGIDIPKIEHIINHDPPETVEDYIHRAGRTARGSLGGTVSTVATWRDKGTVEAIEKAIGQSLPRCKAPGVEPWVEAKDRPRGRRIVRGRLR